MFLNQLKDFSTKKIVKSQLPDSGPAPSENKIKTIGILFDETYVARHQSLIDELAAAGISPNDISVLVFKDKIKRNESFEYPVFSHSDFSWTAKISHPEVRKFIAKPFDLLISYYDIEKAPLLLVSHLSKAGFKVGFTSVDKRVSHFMINTAAENYKVFSEEMIKYLKILNKLP